MTSTVKRTSDSKPGLTLLEIVIVITIIALGLGGVAALMTFSSDEYALKKASREVEGMAKRARATATLKQIPYALEFSPGMVRLMPWAEAIGSERVEIAADRLDAEQPPTPHEPVHWELTLDNGMQSQLRRWDSDQWIAMKEGERQLWRFDPDGLCEPIGLELWLEGGRISMEFNPLTAAINSLFYESQ